jgi:hypothetical protein
MDVLQQAQQQLATLCADAALEPALPLSVRCLTPDEAIGPRADENFVIKKGKERVIEAFFDGFRGQAFTDHPQNWQGTLDQLLGLDLAGNGRFSPPGSTPCCAVRGRLKAPSTAGTRIRPVAAKN